MDQLHISNSLSRRNRDARRSRRITLCVPLLLRWQEPGGEAQQAAAQTVSLSRYGCVLTCQHRLRVATELWVEDAAAQKSARARVVYRELAGSGPVKLGVEFLDVDDFWAEEFKQFSDDCRIV